MQLDSITLTLNNQTRTFQSIDGTWFNATEISKSFGLPLPSQWRNAHSRYYHEKEQILTVNGGNHNANLHSQFYHGTWMTRTALHAWAYSVDVNFSNKVLLAFEAAADGRLREAQDIATSISSVVSRGAGIYDNTITVREAISQLKLHGYISRNIQMSKVFLRMQQCNLIRHDGSHYITGGHMGYIFSESRGNVIRICLDQVHNFANWINREVL